MNRLERLLRPQSIAVFGGQQAAVVVEQTIKMGYAGDIWPVHPKREDVAGLKTYRNVNDLPDAPDAAWIGVNRLVTIDVVKELAARGCGGAVCYASGFQETAAYDPDGGRLEAELIEAAGSMPIIGPNCYGLINYADGALLWPDHHGGIRLASGECGVAIITQSSSIAINISMQKRGLPIAFLMTAGNQAQTGISDIALGLLEDHRVSALGLHIEGFDSVAGFERLAARARELKKPIIAMKVGRSEQARQATLSHTASLAGSDVASGAFLKRLGIARVDSLPGFLEALKLLHVAGPLPGSRLSSMSCSGGEASLMADGADGRCVNFPDLTEKHYTNVKSTLGPMVAVANPLDYNTYIWNNEAAMTATFTAMASGGFDFNMLVLDFPRPDRCPNVSQWGNEVLGAFEAALRASKSNGGVVSTMPENMPEECAAWLIARDIVPLFGIREALDAAEAAAFIGQAWEGAKVQPVDTSAASATESQHVTLDEAEAKEWLIGAGLPVPAGERVSTSIEAIASATKLGFPVALKALGVAHKSEVGAVRLNLSDADALSRAARDLLPLGRGLYVERMVSGGVAELIVGFTRDPVFGAVMTLGTGGVMVELLRDTISLLLPATRDEIEAALQSLRLYPLLDGYRGKPKADIESAVDAIVSIADFVLTNAGQIEELDINPLIVCTKGAGAWIADALLVVEEKTDIG